MQDNMLIVVGNIVADPELRVLGSGVAMTRFRVASTQRRLDRETGEWRDTGRTYLGVTCWRRLAEHTAGALRKGDPVVVVGRLAGREWERDGQRRYGYELEASVVAVDLARVQVQLARRVADGAPGDGQPSADGAVEPDPAAVGDPMTAPLASAPAA